jgi:hypothetical protein
MGSVPSGEAAHGKGIPLPQGRRIDDPSASYEGAHVCALWIPGFNRGLRQSRHRSSSIVRAGHLDLGPRPFAVSQGIWAWPTAIWGRWGRPGRTGTIPIHLRGDQIPAYGDGPAFDRRPRLTPHDVRHRRTPTPSVAWHHQCFHLFSASVVQRRRGPTS